MNLRVNILRKALLGHARADQRRFVSPAVCPSVLYKTATCTQSATFGIDTGLTATLADANARDSSAYRFLA